MISSIDGTSPANPELLNGFELSADSLRSGEDFAALLMVMLVGSPSLKPEVPVPDANFTVALSCSNTAGPAETSPIQQLPNLIAATVEPSETASQKIGELVASLGANPKSNTAAGSVGTVFEREISYQPPIVELGKKDVERATVTVLSSQVRSDSQPDQALVGLATNSENESVNSQEQSWSENFQKRARDDQAGHTDNSVRLSSNYSAKANRSAAAETDQIESLTHHRFELPTHVQNSGSTDLSRQAVVDATLPDRSEANRNDGELFAREQKTDLTHFPAVSADVPQKNDPMATKSEPVAALPARVIHHVADEIAVQVRHKHNEALIVLDPPELGSLRIALTVEGDKIHARIIAESHESGSLIHHHLPELKEALQAHRLDLMEVHIDSGNWNGSQGDLNRHFLGDHGDQRQWRGESGVGVPAAEPASTPAVEGPDSIGRFSRWA